jgi:DNA-binding MarR family transcriptional regulator
MDLSDEHVPLVAQVGSLSAAHDQMKDSLPDRKKIKKLPPPPPELETWLQMIRTFWTLQSKVEDSLKQHKLTLAQFDLLAMLLGLGDNLNQQALADHLAVTKGNMVGLVNRLSRRGLVKRVPSRKGRRANIIRLTASGRTLVMTALPSHLRLVAEMMSPLSLGKLQELRTLLSKLEGSGRDSVFR